MPIRSAVPAILALLWLAWPAPTAADCEPAGAIQEELPDAPIAFVGTVSAANGSTARFAVAEVWAGDVAATVEVHGLVDEQLFGEDDRTWRVGAQYLVLPVVYEGRLRDSICTATTEWHDELADLRPATAHAPPDAPLETAPRSASPAWLLIAALGVLAVGSAVAFLRRR